MKHVIFATTFLALAGCAVLNKPINAPLETGENAALVAPAEFDGIADGETYVGLAFSGGGMRASAFAHGMLEALRDSSASDADPDGILSEVRLVTGVSGGSVTAAYFGLYGPNGVNRYRDLFLVKNAERYMANNAFNPLTIARGLSGGANGRRTFGRFLDETLFDGATFGDLKARSDIKTWINAADVANQTTFLFTPETFDALCSDLARYPLSDAVAASAAFPLVFAPVVVEAHQGGCDYTEPDWLTAARYNPEASAAMRAHAKALEGYADPDKGRYVKLLDGGITDNFGTTGLAIERARARNGFAPLSAEEAVRLKRFLFLVADAGVEKDPKWRQRLRGPGGANLAMSIAGSAMGAASRTGYDAMRLQFEKWEEAIVEFRCSLPRSEVRRLRGSTAGWDCRDVKFFVGLVGFDGLPQEMQADLDEIPTRLKLKLDQVDLAIEAGRMATRDNPELRGFLVAAGLDGARRKVPAGARLITPVSR